MVQDRAEIERSCGLGYFNPNNRIPLNRTSCFLPHPTGANGIAVGIIVPLDFKIRRILLPIQRKSQLVSKHITPPYIHSLPR